MVVGQQRLTMTQMLRRKPANVEEIVAAYNSLSPTARHTLQGFILSISVFGMVVLLLMFGALNQEYPVPVPAAACAACPIDAIGASVRAAMPDKVMNFGVMYGNDEEVHVYNVPFTFSGLFIPITLMTIIAACFSAAAETSFKTVETETIASIDAKIRAMLSAAAPRRPLFMDGWHPAVKWAIQAAAKGDRITALVNGWDEYCTFLQTYVMGEVYTPVKHAAMGYLAPAVAMQLLAVAKGVGDETLNVVIVTPPGQAEVRMRDRLAQVGDATNAIKIVTSADDLPCRYNMYVIIVDARHVPDAPRIINCIVARTRLVIIDNWASSSNECECGRPQV